MTEKRQEKATEEKRQEKVTEDQEERQTDSRAGCLCPSFSITVNRVGVFRIKEAVRSTQILEDSTMTEVRSNYWK